MKIWSSTSNFNRKSEVALQIITRFYYIIESWLPYLLPEIIWHFRWKRTLWSSIDILPLDALLRCHQQIAMTGTSGLSYQILYPKAIRNYNFAPIILKDYNYAKTRSFIYKNGTRYTTVTYWNSGAKIWRKSKIPKSILQDAAEHIIL